MTRNPCRGWEQGDVVTRENLDGEAVCLGTVAVKRAKAGHAYVQVRLQNTNPSAAAYAWPDNWVIGQGRKRGTCLECSQRFRTDDPDPSGFCPPCDRRFAKAAAAATDTRSISGLLRGARTPMKRTADTDPKDIAAIMEADAKESIF